jgi:hypothetical protein
MAPLPLIEWEGGAMLPKAESACFVIADITGYTHFVSGQVRRSARDPARARAAVEEPTLPVSQRFLTQPLHAR